MQPHDLRGMMVFGRTKRRFSVGAAFSIRVPLDLVEEGNQLVGSVEGGLRRVLDRAPDFSLGGHRQGYRCSHRTARGEGVNVAHGQRQSHLPAASEAKCAASS